MANTLSAILRPEVQRIFDHFSTLFNARIVFFSTEGELVAACRNRQDSSYCMLMRERLFGIQKCRSLDRKMCGEAGQHQSVLCYECHAGLVEATKPIVHCGRILGYMTIGQLRTQRAIPPAVRNAWESQGYSIDELRHAYNALGFVTTEQKDALLDLFSIMVDYIVAHQMIVLATNRDIEIALAFMEQHAAEALTLADVARITHKSPSTISHLFARHLGQSFKRTLIEMKVRHAEEHMRQNPGTTVSEAAFASGFNDPLYFSRLYKRYRKIPPSHFLTACLDQ